MFWASRVVVLISGSYHEKIWTNIKNHREKLWFYWGFGRMKTFFVLKILVLGATGTVAPTSAVTRFDERLLAKPSSHNRSPWIFAEATQSISQRKIIQLQSLQTSIRETTWNSIAAQLLSYISRTSTTKPTPSHCKPQSKKTQQNHSFEIAKLNAPSKNNPNNLKSTQIPQKTTQRAQTKTPKPPQQTTPNHPNPPKERSIESIHTPKSLPYKWTRPKSGPLFGPLPTKGPPTTVASKRWVVWSRRRLNACRVGRQMLGSGWGFWF